ncbi:MAG: sulfate ABC transporter permease subunit [Proteobacteria bacterium]|nr:sulfate ABC transporter permease subunit [Pseudomonadota bacterium]
MRPALTPTSRWSLLLRGAVIAWMLLLVVLPLVALAIHGLRSGVPFFWAAITEPQAKDAVALTLWTALLISLINAVLGTATAWLLTRYQFRGRRLLATLIDLPLAIPTLVTGIMLVVLFGPMSPLGAWFEGHGIYVAFHSPIIVLALGFVTLPFSVRMVQPVLADMDRAEEEAAASLGASRLVTFVRIIWPSIGPAVLGGALQTFARAMAEFGSIVVVSGNVPHETLTAPVYIYGQVESGDSHGAAAVALALVTLSLLVTLFSKLMVRWGVRRHA